MTTMAVEMNGLARSWQFLTAPRGDRRWDVFLRSTAAAALLGIPIVLLMPGAVTYVLLAILSLPANSPLSPILPSFFEPIIIEMAKWAPAIPVTLVATVGYMYMEYVNWHVYAWVLNRDRLEGVRSNRWVRWGVDNFSRAPFWMTVIFAFTPLPFWAARVLAILNKYPLRRFLVATVVGRVPRWYLYALFGGAVSVPVWILIGVMVVPAAIVIAGRLMRKQSLLAETEGEARPG
jgi:membrane protein YqaA with SNARE-associated domain